METLRLYRGFFPSGRTFGDNNSTPNTPCWLLLSHPSCTLRTASLRKLVLHSPSRCLKTGSLNTELENTRSCSQRKIGLACRANPEGINPLKSDPYEDASEDEAGIVRGSPVVRIIGAIGEFASANFLIVALFKFQGPTSEHAIAIFNEHLTPISNICHSLVLISSVIFALAWPAPGRVAQQMGLTKWCTSAIFGLSGLNLRSGDTERAVSAWPAGLFGLVSILLITPLAAIPILSLQSSPRELVAGLAVFACVPTTLSSAVSLTQIAGANTALALGMTVFSNLISIVTLPFTLTTLVGGGIGVSIPPGPLLRSLVQTLLLPLLFGKILRETFSGIANAVDGNRQQVSMLSSFVQGLVLPIMHPALLLRRRHQSWLMESLPAEVPWMQLSSSKDRLLQIEPLNLLVVAAAGLTLHIVYLATNSILIKICPSRCIHIDYNSRAVLLVTSQKSIVVSIAVIDRLGGAFGNAGLLVLPCIAAQLSQVMLDSILVNKWLQHDAKTQVGAVPA